MIGNLFVRKTWRQGLPLLLGVCALTAAVPAAQAGTVTIVSQERTIEASARGLTTDQQSASAPDAGPFNKTLFADGGGTDVLAKSSAGISSHLNPDRFEFLGSFKYELQDNRSDQTSFPSVEAFGSYLARTVFTLDAAFDYKLSYGVSVLNGSDPNVAIESPLTFMALDGGDRNQGVTPGNEVTGRLTPGTYSLDVPRSVRSGANTGSEFISYEEEFAVTLDFTPVDGGDGGGGQPVPLPPAVWSGMLILGAGALNRLRKRRVD